MNKGKQEIEKRMQHFEEECHKAGIKRTHQRMVIFREIAEACDHPDAETVLQCVRKRIPTVSLDTVYRTLWLLGDLGLVHTLGPPRERTRFDSNLAQHHHFVCLKCGLTKDFYSQDFEKLKLPKDLNTYGQVETTRVEARGLCHKCAQKKTKKG